MTKQTHEALAATRHQAAIALAILAKLEALSARLAALTALAVLATACGGYAPTPAPEPCDGHSLIEMATSALPCDDAAPACAFDASYRVRPYGDPCEAFRFTCQAGAWTGTEAPGHKASLSKRNTCDG